MKSMHKFLWFCLIGVLLVSGCGSQRNIPATDPAAVPTSTSESVPQEAPTSAATEELTNILFDDFEYSSQDEMAAHGWIVRAGTGWPGVPGATFRAENVSFLEDTEIPNNRLLRMTSSTDGTSESTFQTQVCHQRKYLEGTYAARVYFRDTPTSGPDGDQVVETFYTITPYEEAFKPEYSEMDFEYLPNGGWGLQATSFAFTTWETVRIEPWSADNTSDWQVKSMDGWRTLVVQVKDGSVRYYVSGLLTAEHSGNYYPDSPMSINFNLWFIDGGLLRSGETRIYEEDIDWVYHEAGVILTPEQVNKKVRALREAGTRFVDAVPAASPALESLCDL